MKYFYMLLMRLGLIRQFKIQKTSKLFTVWYNIPEYGIMRVDVNMLAYTEDGIGCAKFEVKLDQYEGRFIFYDKPEEGLTYQQIVETNLKIENIEQTAEVLILSHIINNIETYEEDIKS